MSLLHPAHAITQKIYFLVSLPTLSDQDRELYTEAVLCARKQVWEQAPPIYRQASNSSTPVDILYYQTCKVYKKRLRKRKRQQELLRGKINESCKCDDLERREEIVVFAIKVTRCFELSVLTIYPIAFCWLSITAIYLLLSISTIFQYFKLTIPSTYSVLAIYFNHVSFIFAAYRFNHLWRRVRGTVNLANGNFRKTRRSEGQTKRRVKLMQARRPVLTLVRLY